MKNFPAIIVLLLVFLGVTAFAVSDKQKEEYPLPASTQLLDRLTDELQYLVQLGSTAEERLGNQVHAQLARKISDTFQTMNRDLCQLIIKNGIPAKRELSQAHHKGIVSLIPARDQQVNVRFESLLRAEFDSLDVLITRQKGLIEDRHVLDFVDQVLIAVDNFENQIEILQ